MPRKNKHDPRWADVKDVCAATGKRESTVRRWCATGKLPAKMASSGYEAWLVDVIACFQSKDKKISELGLTVLDFRSHIESVEAVDGHVTIVVKPRSTPRSTAK